MTFPDHKSLDELKEQSVFEVLGALEESELAQLDRDFREVPGFVQAELRDIQAEVALGLAALSTEEPAASLRARTVASMMTEVEAQDHGLAPIAQIGAPARRRAGRTPVRSIDAVQLMEQAMETATARAEASRFARSAYWWRAAAIALIAALVVAIYFERQANWWSHRVGEAAMHRHVREDVLALLNQTGFREMVEGQADVIRGLRTVSSDGNGSATVLVDTRTQRVMLVTLGLQPTETYSLRVTRDDGRKELIGTITPQESVSGVMLAGELANVVAVGQLELVDSRGRVILST